MKCNKQKGNVFGKNLMVMKCRNLPQGEGLFMLTKEQIEYLRKKFHECGKSSKQLALEIDVSESTFSRAKNSDFANLNMAKLDLLISAIGGSMQEFFELSNGISEKRNNGTPLFNDINALTLFFEHHVTEQRLIFQSEIAYLKAQNKKLIWGLISSLLLFIAFLLIDCLNGAFGWFRY